MYLFQLVFFVSQKPYLKWTQEARRGSHHSLQLHLSSRPNRKKYILHLQQKEGYYLTTQQEEERIFLAWQHPQPMRVCHNSAQKSLQTPSFLQWTLYNSPSQLSFLLCQEWSFPIHLCLFCCLTYRIVVAIFLNFIYMHYYTVLVFFFLTHFTGRMHVDVWQNQYNIVK